MLAARARYPAPISDVGHSSGNGLNLGLNREPLPPLAAHPAEIMHNCATSTLSNVRSEAELLLTFKVYHLQLSAQWRRQDDKLCVPSFQLTSVLVA